MCHTYIYTHCIDFEDILTSPNVCCYSLTEQFNSNLQYNILFSIESTCTHTLDGKRPGRLQLG